MNEPYISRQITVYQTDKKLIEFLDKLKSASVEHYAHLHADSERTEDGRRRISCIGITMLDYSGGTGDSKITARANLSPDTVLYLFEHIRTNKKALTRRMEALRILRGVRSELEKLKNSL